MKKKLMAAAMLASLLLTGVLSGQETVMAEGCITYGISGTLLSGASEALDRLNEIRYNACVNGEADPRYDGSYLTEADYVPLKWSTGLADIAQIRAGEIEVAGESERPNGQSLSDLYCGGVSSDGEITYWGGNDSMTSIINSWANDGGGRYREIIDPNNTYVGMALFYADDGIYSYVMAAEFSESWNDLDQTMYSSGSTTQYVDIADSHIGCSMTADRDTLDTGEGTYVYMQATAQFSSGAVLNLGGSDSASYSSSDPSVADVDGSGYVSAVGSGTAVIYGNLNGMQREVAITVSHTHDIVVTDSVEATCQQEGYTGDEVCSLCGEVVSQGSVIPMTDHIPGDVVIENEKTATCQEEGSYDSVISCVYCGTEISRETVTTEKADHVTEIQGAKEATCQEEGYTGNEVCTVCGETIVTGETIDKTSHTPGETVIENEKPATCQEEGSYDNVVTCTVCGTEISRETVITEKTDHVTEIQGAKEATCQEEGYTGNEVCTVCEQTIVTGETIAKTEHTPGEAVIENEKPATCQAEGSYDNVVTCTVCGTEISRETVTTEKTDHQTELQNAKEATCQEKGYTGDQVCKDCGTVTVKGEDIPETDHKPGEPVKENEKPATCQAEGSYEKVVKCTVCGTEISRETVTTEKTDHQTELQNAKEATCQEKGYTGDQVCKDCGTVTVKGEEIPKTDHKPGEPVKENEKPATCQSEGSYEKVVKCTVCGTEISRETVTMAKIDHQIELKNVKEATCQAAGYTGDKVCTLCNQVMEKGQNVPKKDHKAGNTVKENETAATCSIAGHYDEVVYCVNCKAELRRVKRTTATTEHKVKIVGNKAATASAEGYTGDAVCEVCGAIVKKGQVIPAEAGYSIVSGERQTWLLGGEGGLEVTGSGQFSEFKEIRVDSAVLSSDKYTVKQSAKGTAVVLNASYLNSLTPGAYRLDLVWQKGSAATSFIIGRSTNGQKGAIKTGDTSMTIIYAAVFAICLVALIAVGVILIRKGRKGRKSRRRR